MGVIDPRELLDLDAVAVSLWWLGNTGFGINAGGSVILIASQMARVATAGQAAYLHHQGGAGAAGEGGGARVRRAGGTGEHPAPGGVATNRLVQRFGDLATAEAQWGPKHPLGRPEEIADGAVFLASDESRFMTGADLLIDGGYAAS